jgi:hypothetical protein
MSTPGAPLDGHVKVPGGTAIGMGQRFGRADRHPSPRGAGGDAGIYLVRDDETGITYSFSYADIVTEGFRTIRSGERVRFLIDPADPGHAVYVIRLDVPDIGDYYR